MKEFTIDTEVTTWSKGSPYDQRNRFVCASWITSMGEVDAQHWSEDVRAFVQEQIDSSDWIVMFNAKFDVAWLRKCGIRFDSARIWDTQLAEFILENQTIPYPSLENTAVKYGIGHKIDVIKTEYWDKGINTDEIPWDVLSEYAKQDVLLTREIYFRQLEQFATQPLKFKLFKLQCQDLLILQEMEWNGLVYDVELCNKRAQELQEEIDGIYKELSSIYPDVPINFGSPDQLSAFLYGGNVEITEKEHIGFYKSGAKKGQPRYRNKVVVHTLPRMYEPLKGSELKKEGLYSTSEDTLKKLKGKKRVVDLLLRLAKLDKLNSTYYTGLPKRAAERHWPEGKLHGQFNQVRVATGRLSSSDPNLQNMAGEVDQIFITRF